MSGEPFHRCTHTALSPKGEIYVSDGYGNARVHKYSPDGKLLMSWGEPGTDPGQFNIVHNIVTDADGWVYVADRENHRVQVFDGNGKYETQWNNLHRPCALCCCGGGKQPNFIIGELGPGMPVNRKVPNLGPRLSIVDAKGKRIARLGGENGPGLETGKFLAPHGIALDSKGDIYVGEVGVTDWKTSFPDTPMPPEVRVTRCLQKLEKIPRRKISGDRDIHTAVAIRPRRSPRAGACRFLPRSAASHGLQKESRPAGVRRRLRRPPAIPPRRRRTPRWLPECS